MKITVRPSFNNKYADVVPALAEKGTDNYFAIEIEAKAVPTSFVYPKFPKIVKNYSLV